MGSRVAAFLLLIIALVNFTLSATSTSADAPHVTVSGFSAGGFFSQQLHIAYSSVIKGSAVLAGGPYGCSQGDFSINGLMKCSATFNVDVDLPHLVDIVHVNEKAGLIDDLKNLDGSKAFFMRGTLDEKVFYNSTFAASEMFKRLGAQVDTKTVFDIGAAHTLSTDDFGIECGDYAAPWIANCHFDALGEGLAHLGLTINPKVPYVKENLQEYNQEDFGPSPFKEGDLNGVAYAYIPSQCQDDPSACPLHFHFHGCGQDVDELGDVYVKHNGLLQHSESSGFVLILPQSRPTPVLMHGKIGCFDFLGYSGQEYLTQFGRQMSNIMEIIKFFSTSKL